MTEYVDLALSDLVFDFTSLEFLTVFFQRPFGPEVDDVVNTH